MDFRGEIRQLCFVPLLTNQALHNFNKRPYPSSSAFIQSPSLQAFHILLFVVFCHGLNALLQHHLHWGIFSERNNDWIQRQQRFHHYTYCIELRLRRCNCGYRYKYILCIMYVQIASNVYKKYTLTSHNNLNQNVFSPCDWNFFHVFHRFFFKPPSSAVSTRIRRVLVEVPGKRSEGVMKDGRLCAPSSTDSFPQCRGGKLLMDQKSQGQPPFGMFLKPCKNNGDKPTNLNWWWPNFFNHQQYERLEIWSNRFIFLMA